MRLGIALLLISRPRPMRNPLAHWLGGMATGITAALGLLTLPRDVAPMIFQHMTAAAASSTARHIQIASGLIALSIAALIPVGLSARQRAQLAMCGGGPSAAVLPPSTPTAVSRRQDS